MSPWEQFGLEFIPEFYPRLLRGLAETIRLAMVAFSLALTIGCVVGLLRDSRYAPIAAATAGYVHGVRMLPLLVWLYIVYFGLPEMGVTLDAFTSAAVALGVYGSAQVAEVVRASFDAIDRGQDEAGIALGLTYIDRLRFVLLPQALPLAGVGIGNYSIWLLKDTALASTIAVYELMTAARQIIFETYVAFPVYLAVAAIFLVMSLIAAILVRRLETRWSRFRGMGATVG